MFLRNVGNLLVSDAVSYLETLSPRLKLSITSYLGLFVLFPIRITFDIILQLYVIYIDELYVHVTVHRNKFLFK
jgi:hypothetical protein